MLNISSNRIILKEEKKNRKCAKKKLVVDKCYCRGVQLKNKKVWLWHDVYAGKGLL